MSRIRGIAPEEMTGDGRALFERAQQLGAPDPGMVAVFVRSKIGVAYLEFWNKLTGETDLPIRLKELIRVRVAVARECGYCATVRSNAAKNEGVTEDLIAEMLDYEYSDQFSPPEKAALRFADIYKDQPTAIMEDDALWDDMRAHFTDEQIIELCIFLTINVGGGRLTKAAELISWDQACELKPKLREVMQRKRAREAQAGAPGAMNEMVGGPQ